jgi:hypothetical protein
MLWEFFSSPGIYRNPKTAASIFGSNKPSALPLLRASSAVNLDELPCFPQTIPTTVSDRFCLKTGKVFRFQVRN